MAKAEDLAQAHWEYVRSLLESHGTEPEDLALAEFHYLSAFIHGFKHGVEYTNECRYHRLTLASDLKKELLACPDAKAAYEALESEFTQAAKTIEQEINGGN